MKASFRFPGGFYFRKKNVRPPVSAWLALGLLLAVGTLRLSAADTLAIQAVSVDGKNIPLRNKGAVSLGPFAKNITFEFGAITNLAKPPLRLRYMLEGFESVWHEYSTEMAFTVRFYNNSGDQISQNIYHVNGESTGWTGSLESSSLRHRRETLVVPPQATRLLIVISSAGPPETVGIYVVGNLVVSKSSGTQGNVVLLQSPFDNEQGDHERLDPPAGWMHDGTRPSMAKIVKLGQEPQTRAFAIVDEDIINHAEWHNILDTAPAVTPGDSLVVEWNEMYSMGSGTYHYAEYGGLSAGKYRFRVRGIDVMGLPTGDEGSISVFVPQPLWREPWFLGIMLIVITAMIVGISRYYVWRRMMREMNRLKQQRALEQERLRIAHDIHDDLGARVTQISLLSAMAHDNNTFPEKARSDFDMISKMSRELVSALYETVWAVNPENDNLEAQGNYLCQMANQLCEGTPVRCRFHVLGMPHDVQISSQTRHNINMSVKEALHNAIKHSKATEVTIRMTFTDGVLDISIHDDGAGFQPADKVGGHGLNNMKQRLANIGGKCFIESSPGQGTTVRIRLTIPPDGDQARL
jgi:signal transduction histidine kinase